MATVFCTGCQKNYGVPPAMAGRTVRCKACGGTLTIPVEPVPVPAEPVPVEPISAEPDSSLPVAAIPVGFDSGTIPVSGPDAFPPPLPPRTAATAWPPPPPPYRPFQPTPAAFSLGFDFKVWKIVPVVLAAAALAFGISEWTVSGNSTVAPQPITCQALETTGCGKNHHIRLTDFSALRVYFVGEKNKPSQYELVALVPPGDVKKFQQRKAGSKIADEGSVDGGAIHVFLKTTDLKQNTDFLGVVNRPYIDGMVGGPLDTIPSEAATILRDHYPGLITTNSIILEEGKTPKSGLALSMMAGGALLLILSLALFFIKYE